MAELADMDQSTGSGTSTELEDGSAAGHSSRQSMVSGASFVDDVDCLNSALGALDSKHRRWVELSNLMARQTELVPCLYGAGDSSLGGTGSGAMWPPPANASGGDILTHCANMYARALLEPSEAAAMRERVLGWKSELQAREESCIAAVFPTAHRPRPQSQQAQQSQQGKARCDALEAVQKDLLACEECELLLDLLPSRCGVRSL